jgi:hypothetical protein
MLTLCSTRLVFSSSTFCPQSACMWCLWINVKQSHYRPWGFQEVGVPRFQDSRHMKVARLSNPTHRLPLPPGNIPGTHVQAVVRPKNCVNEKFQWHHRESNPRPSNLLRSASTNCATMCPYSCHIAWVKHISTYFMLFIPSMFLQCIIQHIHSLIHHLWRISTSTSFGTKVPPSGSRYKEGT